MSWLAEVTGQQRERFWSRVCAAPDASGCWLWTGAQKHNGYGKLRLRVNGRAHDLLAHRFAAMVRWGRELEPDEYVTHRCDQPRCVRPSHLLVGDAATNCRDKFQRNRDGNPMTFEDAERMRGLWADGWSYGRIAERFGMDERYVYRVVRGERWNPSLYSHNPELQERAS